MQIRSSQHFSTKMSQTNSVVGFIIGMEEWAVERPWLVFAELLSLFNDSLFWIHLSNLVGWFEGESCQNKRRWCCSCCELNNSDTYDSSRCLMNRRSYQRSYKDKRSCWHCSLWISLICCVFLYDWFVGRWILTFFCVSRWIRNTICEYHVASRIRVESIRFGYVLWGSTNCTLLCDWWSDHWRSINYCCL